MSSRKSYDVSMESINRSVQEVAKPNVSDTRKTPDPASSKIKTEVNLDVHEERNSDEVEQGDLTLSHKTPSFWIAIVCFCIGAGLFTINYTYLDYQLKKIQERFDAEDNGCSKGRYRWPYYTDECSHKLHAKYPNYMTILIIKKIVFWSALVACVIGLFIIAPYLFSDY